MATDTAPPPDTAVAPPKPKSKLVLIVGVIAVLICAQVVITWLLMPKASAPAPAEGPAKVEEPATAQETDEGVSEVSMGEFNCTNTSSPGTTVQVDFKLSALTPTDKVGRLKERIEGYGSRIRQTVAKVVRSAKLEDLNEPSLATLRRSIKEEVNRLLRTNIDDVVITDFRHLEQ